MVDFIPVTRTKIIVPRRRAELLSRTRLLTLLEELLDNRLIIVAAPAGYGKTSLLVDFATSSQWPFCWYALDNLDQDPQRFIAHFISAMSLRFPQFGKTCMAALQGMSQDHLDLDTLVALIVNDAYENITEHFVMVLDDFHLVENSRSVIYFINRFIQDVDENCHLVLASRALLTLPDLPLLVARSMVGGLSFDELSFQTAEIQALLEQNYHLALSEPEAADLARETEGWVTGLLLSSQLMGKTIANRLRVARVSGVGLYEYLAQQVLSQQREDVQLFLLRSSLLDEFDLASCEEIIGKALDLQLDWRPVMESVMRLNLFVLPVGEEGQYVRYHHLFLDFLRDRVTRERPEEARRIRQRQAQVYEERADWERAYHTYQLMGDIDAVVLLLEKAGSAMITQGRLITLSDWLTALPEEMLMKHPELISLRGAVAVMRGDLGQGLMWFDQAIASMTEGQNDLQLAQALYRRSVSNRLAGQYNQALDDVNHSLALLEGAYRDHVFYADALGAKGSALGALGQINDSLTNLQNALKAYQVLGDASTAAKVTMDIASVLKRQGRYAEAEEAYQKALIYYQEAGNPVWQANTYNNLGVLQHTNGDYVTATASFERAIHYAKVGGAPRLEAYALTSIGDLYQELEAIQETQDAYRQARELALRVQDGYLIFYLNLVEARLKQTLNEIDDAATLLRDAQAMAEKRGSQYEQNVCRMEWGRLHLLKNELEDALADFNAGLKFFVNEGYQQEIPRARLFMLVAAARLGLSDPVAAQLEPLDRYLGEPDNRKLLVAAGREAVFYLEEMRSQPEVKQFVPALLHSIDQFDQSIPGLRRLVRRHAAVVPFAPPKMVIRTLGKTQVKITDHVISSSEWQVQTARDLFLLLVANPDGLTKERIGDIFWPDSTLSELKLRFKNTIYRLRHAAGKDVILFKGDDFYLFNRGVDYEYDVESLQKELSLAEKADTDEKKEAHLQNAVRLYRGAYLPDVDASWVIVERERLHQQYLEALLKLAGLALKMKNYEGALEFCQRVLKEDPCQEDAHRLAMQVYAAMGKRALVIRQYEQCRMALLTEVDVPPSYQTQALYNSLIH
ncbi:MAG TPA: BTAD domain-containing putative transcriptional regulator [Anaerolineaceae bacterium]